jgi:acetyl-CoA acetyltransferase family protein
MGKGRAATDERPGGALSGLHPVELLGQTLRQLMDRNDVDPAEVEDVVVGCVSQVGEQSGTPGRWAWLAAGLPEHVPGVTIDRRCGSGQQAIDYAAQAIMAGAYDIAVAGGVESMSRIPMISARIGQDPFGPSARARYGDKLVPQGVSAEIVATRYGLTRDAMDEYAARSHQRAAECADAGGFKSEIVSISVPTPDGGVTVVDADESIRRGTTAEQLGNLRSAFRTDELAADWPDLGWHVTAGNSSQITDGASALLIMSEQRANDLGLQPMARIHSFALASADPIEMLTGPIPATEKILARSGLSVADLDHVEVNEAFAPVPLAWIQRFGADPARVNPRGGAIALGHPLGASGARLMTTMLYALQAGGGRFGLQTMCEGGGMANATIIERI